MDLLEDSVDVDGEGLGSSLFVDLGGSSSLLLNLGGGGVSGGSGSFLGWHV